MNAEREARPLLGKVAVVTGASRGIGLALAEALGATGCQLALCARNTKFIPDKEIAERNGIPVLVGNCDVKDRESVAEFMRAVGERYTSIDFLINNAGGAHPTANVETLPVEDWQDVIGTNLTGLFLCTQAALPFMNRGGAIVNNLSIAARQAFPGQAGYVASKHGAKGFTDALREEVRPRGIRVIALLPGATDTDIWNVFWPEAPRDRMLKPETVAQAVVQALTLPGEATAEEIVMLPTSGTL